VTAPYEPHVGIRPFDVYDIGGRLSSERRLEFGDLLGCQRLDDLVIAIGVE
jgi:hypothetical protein